MKANDKRMLEVMRQVADADWSHVGRALQAGGCPNAGPTARFLRACMAAGANPNNIEMEARLRGVEKRKFVQASIEEECRKAGIRPIDSVTLSRNFRKTNLRVFHAHLAAVFRADIKAALRASPPTGRVLGIVDGTVKQTTARPPKPGTKVPKHARRYHLVPTTSNNKDYPYGVGFAVGIVTWVSEDRQITCPFMFHVHLAGDLATPLAQAQVIHEFLLPLKKRIHGILLDRGYDDHRLRNHLAHLGWTVGTRIRLGSGSARNFVDPQTGEVRDLRTVAEEGAKNGPFKERMGHQQGERYQFLAAERLVNAYLVSDTGELGDKSLIFLSVGIEIVGGKPVPDYTRTLAVVVRGPGDLARIARLYFLRWRVETFLEGLGDAAPKPRAKTIQAEVIQYLVLVFCTTRGLLLRLVLVAMGAGRKLLGEPMARYSAATLWRFALGLKRFDDPTD